MQSYRLSVIRHGSTKANENNIYIGRTDYSLSDKGTAQLFSKLEEYDYPYVDIVYTSPLKRCTETASIIYPDTPARIVEDLQEMDLGEFEDKKADELVDNENFRKWLKGGKDVHAPGGESSEEVMARVFKALHEIIMDMMEEEYHHAAVITHGGIIQDILAGYSIPRASHNPVTDFGEGYEFLATAAMWQRSQVVELFGAVPYKDE